jgi:hypothetical protein
MPMLDGLDLYRRLDRLDRERAVNDSVRVNTVIDELHQGLAKALSTPTVVRGWRAQALFASMVAALDGCKMLTQVDLGEIFVDGDPVKAPDFFLHLRNGSRILVDVKHVAAEPNASRFQAKFSASEIARLRTFGELYGAEVYLALYFSSIPIWSLVSIDDLAPGPGGGWRITLEDAMMQNKLVVLNDSLIGVKYPLELIICPDPLAPNWVDHDGKANFTIGAVEIRAGGREVRSEEGKRIAWFLMMNGDWLATDHATVEDSKLVNLTWRAQPEHVADSRQQFEFIGWLSSMYARQFESNTTGPAGVTGLDIRTEPGSLTSLIPHDYQSDDLQIWRFRIHPVNNDSLNETGNSAPNSH